MTAQQIQTELRQFTGSVNYYEHNFLGRVLLLTDGANYVRVTCQCYWLFDIIAQQFHRRISDAFSVVLRYIETDEHWLFTCTDQYTDGMFYQQIIPFSDFPLKEITLWVEGDVCLLPSEH